VTGLWLFVAGLVTSFIGSVVGLGGGFLLVPALRLFFGLPPAIVAGTSLALVVVTNATASVSYAMERRIRARTGLAIAAGGVPASIFGAHIVRAMAPVEFDVLLAALTLAVAVHVLLRSKTRAAATAYAKPEAPWWMMTGVGAIVGVLSGLFGAGGGVVLIPALIYFTELTPHEITATAQFAVLFVSASGLIAHMLQHDLQVAFALPLLIAALIGGPLGARFSSRLQPGRLLFFVGASLIVAAVALVARDLR
jgi:uncharacterized membrane protein YfcA